MAEDYAGLTKALREVGATPAWPPTAAADAITALIAERDALREALKWFIDDIDGTHTVMVEFDLNVKRARAALNQGSGE